MNIKNIGNYRIITGNDFKQIYSKTRMLQINNNRTYYVDIENNKVLKIGERVLKWFNKMSKEV